MKQPSVREGRDADASRREELISVGLPVRSLRRGKTQTTIRPRRGNTSPHWSKSRWTAGTGAPEASGPPQEPWLRAVETGAEGFESWIQEALRASESVPGERRDSSGYVSPLITSGVPARLLGLSFKVATGEWMTREHLPVAALVLRVARAAAEPSPGAIEAMVAGAGIADRGLAAALIRILSERPERTRKARELEAELSARPASSLTLADLERLHDLDSGWLHFEMPARVALEVARAGKRSAPETELAARDVSRAYFHLSGVSHFRACEEQNAFLPERTSYLSPIAVGALTRLEGSPHRLLAKCLFTAEAGAFHQLTSLELIRQSGVAEEFQLQAQSHTRRAYDRIRQLTGDLKLARSYLDLFRRGRITM